jgi:hypothetical protein
MSKGNVFIASMNCRGEHAIAPPNTIKLNVTSAQATNNMERLDFSPMTHNGGYKDYFNFEHYWQSGKVYEGIDHEISKKWWIEQTIPKRKYPMGKNKKILYAVFDDFPNEKMNYITSRKMIYVPKYFNMIKNREAINKWNKILSSGSDIVIYDFDGPRLPDGNVTCMKLTLDLLIEKINDPSYPFGHGYIVGAILLGHTPNDYIHPKQLIIEKEICVYLLEQIQNHINTSTKYTQLFNIINKTNGTKSLNKMINLIVNIKYFGETLDINSFLMCSDTS